MVDAIEIDIMYLWGITALMQSYYQFFYPSWMKAMKLRTLGEWITNPLPQVEDDNSGDAVLENVIVDLEGTIV